MADRRPDHERAQELAATALDFDLARHEREWLAAHLEGCPSCRRMSLMYQADARAIERLPDVSAPDRVRLRVLDAVHGRRRRDPFPLLALAGAGALAIVIAAVVLLRPLDQDLPPTGAQSPSSAPTLTPSPSATTGSSTSPSSPPTAPATPQGQVALDWQPATLPAGEPPTEFRGIAVGRDRAVVSLAGPGRTPALWTSGRGLSWRDAGLPADAFGGGAPFLIVEYGEGFVALAWSDFGRSSAERRIWLSGDGLTWRPDEHPSGTLGAFNYGVLAAGADRLLVGGRTVANETVVWSSQDGTRWTPQDPGDTFRGAELSGLASDGTNFYAFGTVNDVGAIWQTVDGASWTRRPAPDDSSVVAGLVVTPGGLVARGAARPERSIANAAWWSADGEAWDRVTMPPLPSSPNDRITRIVQTDTGLLAIWRFGADSIVGAARSNDGRNGTWKFLDVRGFPPGVDIDEIHQIGSNFVALGRDAGGTVVAFWAAAPA